MAGLTLDTGALIAIERRNRRMMLIWDTAVHDGTVITVPAVVVAEWWRGQRGPVARTLERAVVEPVTDALAHTAGEALAALGLGGAHTIDAIVVASAARRGDIVYTSDFGDLSRLAAYFPTVRVLAV